MGIKSRLLSPLIPRIINDITLSLNSESATFNISNKKQYEWIGDFGREKGILLELLGELEEDDIFFDIGAGYGLYTCFAGNILNEGDIIAFEPFPNRSEILKKKYHHQQNASKGC